MHGKIFVLHGSSRRSAFLGSISGRWTDADGLWDNWRIFLRRASTQYRVKRTPRQMTVVPRDELIMTAAAAAKRRTRHTHTQYDA